MVAYAGIKHRRVIDVLTMRQGPSTQTTSPTAAPASDVATGGVGGGKTGVVAAAQQALHMPAGSYEYSETRPYPKYLYGPPQPVKTDCSGFATLCYKQANLPDPNGLGYTGQGYTGTLLAHGRRTSNPQPGDLAFWHNPDHVCVYIGDGQCIGFGSPPGPVQDSIEGEGQYHQSFLGYRTY